MGLSMALMSLSESRLKNRKPLVLEEREDSTYS
jgi:hypothetical protein